MALHETFTNNADLAFLLGPARPDFNLGNTWFGSVSIWSGAILNPFSNSNPVVEVAVSGISGISAVQAEVFGTRTYDSTGLASVAVSMIEWSLPGSATVLARYTFDSPIVFALSVGRFVGDWRFIDILTELGAVGGTAQDLFNDYFQNADSLIGGAARDIMYGGGGDDMLDGGGGVDLLSGDTGADTFIYRAGDAVTGETVYGGSEVDTILAVGAMVTGDIFQTGGVNIASLGINTLEQVDLNGTEVVVSVGQLAPGGFQSFFGRTGFADQLTITDVSNGSLSSLSLLNWEAQDTVAVVGTIGSDNVQGTDGRDIFLGLSGADIFDGMGGNDRFLILNDDFDPLDQFTGGSGNDVLQVDSTPIATVQMAPITNLRNLGLSGIEVLDIVQGSFAMDGSDFAGSITGTVAAPVTSTTGINRIIGNSDGFQDTPVLLEINLTGMLGIDMRTTVFENWNDGFYIDKTIRIVADATTKLIYCPNEETWVNGSASAVGVFVVGNDQADQIYGSFVNDFVQAGGGADYLVGLSGQDVIDAGEGADYATGGDGGDAIGGAGGNDTLYGEAHNDTLIGGADADSLYGGTEIDVLSGGTGADYLDGGDSLFDLVSYQLATTGVRVDLVAQATNTGEAAGDTLVGLEGVIGSAHDDTLVGDGANNALYGQAGADVLTGGAGLDQILGGTGGDTINGGTGADTMAGGADSDWYFVDGGSDVVVEGQVEGVADRVLSAVSYTLGASVYIEQLTTNLQAGLAAINLTGNDQAQAITGNAGINVLNGAGDNDTILGLGGADTLIGGTGIDSMSGGADSDWYLVDSGSDVVVEGQLDGTADRILSSVSYTLGANVYVELLTTTLQAGLTAINLTGNDLTQAITGNAGSNVLNGAGGNDTILGLGGADTLIGGTGVDSLSGGADSDWYFVDSVSDVVVEGQLDGTADRILTSVSYTQGANSFVEQLTTNLQAGLTSINLTGNDLAQAITGNAGINVLIGNGGKDTLSGLGGDDTLSGGTGADAMNGGSGHDWYFVDALGDTIGEGVGGGTADRVLASASFALAADDDIELLTTNLQAGLTAINLTGNGIAQSITGNAGANVLNGGGGADTMSGLAGLDTFVFNTTLGGGNVDRILDFSVADDTVHLENAVFAALGASALVGSAFTSNLTGAATTALQRIIYESDTGNLFYDGDGSGAVLAAVQFATLTNGLALTASDFFVI